MLKFPSVSGSVRDFTDLTPTVIIIRITPGRIIDLIIARTIGTGDIVIIAIIIPIITGASLIGIATPGLARNTSEPA